jgi:hypothetical protein
LIEPGGITIPSEIYKILNSILNYEELPEEWKESIIVPIYKKGRKTESNDYRVITLPTTYKTLSNIPHSRLNPYAEEIIWDHQYGI